MAAPTQHSHHNTHRNVSTSDDVSAEGTEADNGKQKSRDKDKDKDKKGVSVAGCKGQSSSQ